MCSGGRVCTLASNINIRGDGESVYQTYTNIKGYKNEK